PAHHHKPASRQNYDTFVELLTKRKPNGECELLKITSRSGHRKLRVVGLDSNRVESEKLAGLGYVAPEAFEQAAALLEADPVEKFDQVYTWMAVHHHVFPATSIPLEDALDRRVSLICNALDIQHYAAKWQVELILHGHEHQPSVTLASRWP